MKNQYVGILIATVLTGISYGLGVHFNWEMTKGWLLFVELGAVPLLFIELGAVWTAYWGTYLCVVQTRTNYPINAVSVALFAVLFWQQNLLASMALQLFLFPWFAYGYLRWQTDASTRPVTSLVATFIDDKDYSIFGYAALAAVMYGFGLWINTKLGGSVAFWDTSIFALSIVGQLTLDNKRLESWIVWLVVDIIAVPLYWSQDLKILSIQMGLFGIQTLYGLYMWHTNRHTYNPIVNVLPINF